MRCRRDRNHHPQALKAAAVLGAVLFAVWGTPTRADVQKINSDGTVHRIDVETWPQPSGKNVGTALRHTRQSPTGAVESALVPGTDDLAPDRDPALEIDATSGAPILVWSRNEGAGQVIFISRFDRGSWSAPRAVAPAGAGDQVQPELRVGSLLVQVAWRMDAGVQSGQMRASLDRVTLGLAFGPEQLPLPDPGSTPPPGPGPEPPARDAYFAREIPSFLGGSPGRLVIWGVRDAPVPVEYMQTLTLPSEAKNLSQTSARWVRDRFLVSYVSGTRLYYTVRSAGGSWSEHRVVNLGPSTSATDARMQVEEMIRRGSPTN